MGTYIINGTERQLNTGIVESKRRKRGAANRPMALCFCERSEQEKNRTLLENEKKPTCLDDFRGGGRAPGAPPSESASESCTTFHFILNFHCFYMMENMQVLIWEW